MTWGRARPAATVGTGFALFQFIQPAHGLAFGVAALGYAAASDRGLGSRVSVMRAPGGLYQHKRAYEQAIGVAGRVSRGEDQARVRRAGQPREPIENRRKGGRKEGTKKCSQGKKS
jgi:hypothetical protein